MSQLTGRLVLALTVALTLLAIPVPAAAQAVTGTLLGNVTDASGATVPGVSVTATEVATNISRTTVSNEAGAYIFPSLVNGKYTEAENLGDAINTQLNEFEPLIAPDQSFLIFMAGGRADGHGGFDLYISYNRQGAWTKPVNLGDKINSSGNEYSPKISPDGSYFFWTSTRGFADKPLEKRLSYQELTNRLRSPRNGLGDIYQIDIDVLGLGK